jgi:hypothetical protein
MTEDEFMMAATVALGQWFGDCTVSLPLTDPGKLPSLEVEMEDGQTFVLMLSKDTGRVRQVDQARRSGADQGDGGEMSEQKRCNAAVRKYTRLRQCQNTAAAGGDLCRFHESRKARGEHVIEMRRSDRAPDAGERTP